MNPICSCSIKPETTLHFFLHCRNFLSIRTTYFDKTNHLDKTILQLNDESFFTALLFGSEIYNEQVNVQMHQLTILSIQIDSLVFLFEQVPGFFFFVFNLNTLK